MTRRPAFWIAFTLLGLAGVATALRLFTVALPVVSLDISMDRAGALDAAAGLAAGNGWGSSAARSAASFGQVDPSVQTYIELEGGGRPAFDRLMEDGYYEPYQWRVRRFAEGVVEEVQVRFTPSGEPYGFEVRLAEDDAGSGNLTDQEAVALAERQAADNWGVDLDSYRRIESSQDQARGGRLDHTLVYERTDYAAGEARIRLRLVVAGGRLSELTHFVFVPEAFALRYADMRATNDTIALVAQFFFLLVYVLLGAGVGTALLLRGGWVQWRAAFVWGAITAVLFGLNAVNALPLAWMTYDTAISAGTFVLRNVGSGVAIAVFGTPILAFFYLAAESLGRRAFPDHLQQWRFWSRDVARSRTALGMTVAAYLLVGLQLGYVTLFYLGTSRLDGWWSPAEALVQPDLLATYFPWLQAVAIALFAALWEESIFRAVPIACAALLGARYGRRGLWIWGAVLLQALVFAAGHANYPQQPPYARVIELTFPALVWGAVYVRYGLVPTILAHFLYDLALISSVLFASDALLDQSVIVGVAAIPLAVVLWARRREGPAPAPPEWAFNRAWAPRAAHPSASAAAGDAPSTSAPSPATDGDGGIDGGAGSDVSPGWLPSRGLMAVAALIGLALWVTSVMRAEPTHRLEVSRDGALEAARAEMRDRGFDPDGWEALATTGSGRSAAHEYVWEEAGPAAYEAALGEFLAPAQWIVRFARWDVEPEERAEEFTLNVLGDGAIRRFAHVVPESRPGARLEEAVARRLALDALPDGSWQEVGSQEEAHDARTDWTFTFRDPTALADVQAEARLSVVVMGDEVTDLRRFVDLPEEWERERRAAASRRAVTALGLSGVLVLLLGVAAIAAIVVWSRGGLAVGPLWKAASLTAAVMAISFANDWAATRANFTTSQPLDLQVMGVAIALVLVVLVAAAGIGLIAALGHTWSRPTPGGGSAALSGIALGALIEGVRGAVSAFSPGLSPAPTYGEAASFVPAVAVATSAALPFILLVASALALAAAHDRLVGRPQRALTSAAIVLVGLLVVPDVLRDSYVTWLGFGAVASVLVWGVVLLIALSPAVAPFAIGTMVALQALETGWLAPFSGSVPGSVLALTAAAGLAVGWSRELERGHEGGQAPHVA